MTAVKPHSFRLIFEEGRGMRGAELLAVLPGPARIGRVVLAVVLVPVISARYRRLISVTSERAGGDGRDRPKSRMPGWLADRRACGPP